MRSCTYTHTCTHVCTYTRACRPYLDTYLTVPNLGQPSLTVPGMSQGNNM